ncbi:benzoate transporter BenE [Marinomonas agarivorans]|nr:benzoate transporter BenE [Marinomonas agarivorans]
MKHVAQLWNDISLSALVAGFVVVLVGFASSVAIIIEAAHKVGADQTLVTSWIMALGIGMGLSSFFLSLYYRMPIVTAWSTPGAALLVTNMTEVSYSEAIGVFIFSGVLTILVGMSGLFQKIMSIIPFPIACAMLAGILFQFGVRIFDSLAQAPYLVCAMLLGYLIAKRFFPRYAVLIVLLIGLSICLWNGGMVMPTTEAGFFTFDSLVWVSPEWSLTTLLGIGLPLFVVTMTAQNMPGVVVLRAHKVETSASPLISWTGITTTLLAPFGGFAFNLAAITAAISLGEESHKELKKRYIAGLSAGIFYCLTGITAVSIVAFFTALPAAMVAALAGLALLGTIGSNLKMALESDATREAALVTFLVTVSGVSFAGINSAFWGIVFGVLCLLILKIQLPNANTSHK